MISELVSENDQMVYELDYAQNYRLGYQLISIGLGVHLFYEMDPGESADLRTRLQSIRDSER